MCCDRCVICLFTGQKHRLGDGARITATVIDNTHLIVETENEGLHRGLLVGLRRWRAGVGGGGGCGARPQLPSMRQRLRINRRAITVRRCVEVLRDCVPKVGVKIVLLILHGLRSFANLCLFRYVSAANIQRYFRPIPQALYTQSLPDMHPPLERYVQGMPPPRTIVAGKQQKIARKLSSCKLT